MDAVHAGNVQLAPVLGVAEMLAYPADIVDDGADRGVVRVGEGAQLPLGLGLCKQLVVGHPRHAVGHIAVAAAADAEHLVGREVDSVKAAGLNVENSVRSVLNGVGDDVYIGIDLAGFPCYRLDIEDIAGYIGGAHNAQKERVPVDLAEYLVDIDAAGFRVCHRHAELPAGEPAV